VSQPPSMSPQDESEPTEPESIEKTADRRRTGTRARVLFVSGLSLLVLLAVAFVLPVPFVKLAPGPTFNVIGNVNDLPVISIEGTTTYPTTGVLDMLTVLESGGPRGGLTFVDALASWFNAADAVLPRELVYPDDVSGEEVKRRQASMFSTSESDAIGAALNYLKRPVGTKLVVTSVTSDSPADGLLVATDNIISIDAKPVTLPKEVSDAVQAKPIGTSFDFEVKRTVDGTTETKHVSVTSAANPDDAVKPYLGIGVGIYYVPDFTIDFTLKDVGGPSAGLMFTLGLIDKLSPADLAKGRHIAGTGTITPDGTVGPIGGIRQKLAGARNEGAELFLMPAVHCTEAQGHVPDGLTVAAISTLAEAVTAIDTWTAGGAPVPCPAPQG
jgi:PDZ domain-containing protein